MSIDISNKNDPLSISYDQMHIVIEGKEYNNVIDYVNTTLNCNGNLVGILRNDAYLSFTDLKKCNIDKLKEAICAAYSAKLEYQPFIDVLFKTGVADLEYASKNQILGPEGMNLLGSTLTKLRNDVRRENDLLVAYKAYLKLRKLIPFDNLEEFDDKTNSEILEMTGDDDPDATLDVSEDAVADAVKYDGQLSKLIRKYHYDEYVSHHRDHVASELLAAYVEFCKSKHPNMPVTMMSHEIEDDLKNRLIDMYQMGVLPSELADIPQVHKYPDHSLLKLAKDFEPYVKSVKTIKFFEPEGEFRLLSPQDMSTILYIDSRPYPSVSHYIVAVQLQLLDGFDIDARKAHSMLLDDTEYPDTDVRSYISVVAAVNKFLELSTQESYVSTLLMKAYEAKFSVPEMQNLLMDTNNKLLSDKTENNLSGQALMHFRARLFSQKPQKRVAESDKWIVTWYMCRLVDACQALLYARNYIHKVHVDKLFCEFVLYNLYTGCADMMAISSVFPKKYPKNFTSIIDEKFKDTKDFGNMEDVYLCLWKYMCALMLNMKQTKPEAIQYKEYIDTLYKELVYEKSRNVKIIVSAFQNIIKKIKLFVEKRTNKKHIVSTDDVTMAYYMIVGFVDIGTGEDAPDDHFEFVSEYLESMMLSRKTLALISNLSHEIEVHMYDKIRNRVNFFSGY